MDLLSTILNAKQGGAVRELAGSLGLDEGQAASAIAALLPALIQGMERNTAAPGGLDGLMGALTGGGHQRYLEEPATLARPETTADGNAILGHLLGSKEVSRHVAGRAAQQTGLDAGVLKQALPLVAALLMGSMSRHAGQLKQAAPGAASGDLLGGLSSLLDANHDGSVADDLMGFAKKLF